MELLKDYLVSRIISFDKIIDDSNYSKIYFRTNEDLDYISSNIDFMDKDVLTVLSSSDQVFMANYMGARSVDSFDKNRLSLYYYYLRKWTINYKDNIYPFELLDNNYNWFNSLLSNVRPTSNEEKQALTFWKKHIKEETDLSKLFYSDDIIGNNSMTIKELKSVSNLKINFKNIDLFNKINNDKKYDIIMISNIIEWARGDKDKLITIRDNLNKLLNDDGIVVHTRLLNRPDSIIINEDKLFESSFSCPKYEKKPAYCYKKKK